MGGTKTIQVDVRLVASTNRDLPALIQSGEFREDLYYRLNVVPIEIPPLRERREDIPTLVAHFLPKYNAETGKKVRDIHPEAMQLLTTYAWPGNVRELENAIERAVVLARGNVVTPENLSLGLELSLLPESTDLRHANSEGLTLTEMVEAFEKQLLWDAYLKANRVKAEAAKLLGIERSTFRYKFDKHDLSFLDESS